MAFSDLQLKASASKAAIAAHFGLAKLSLFANNYSELEGQYGNAIAVPVLNLATALTWNDSTNNYATSTSGEIDGALVTLDQHFVKSVTISDREQAETGVRWIEGTSEALADSIARGAVGYTFGLINDTTFTGSPTEVDFSTKETIAQLYAVAANADIPVERAVVALNPSCYAQVLGKLDTSVYGGREAVVNGVIPGLFGFKGVICSGSMIPAGTNTVVGAIISDSAIGVASRYIEAGEGYPQKWQSVSEDGLTLGFRRYSDLDLGKEKMACDTLFGAKIFDKTKIVRLIEAEPESTL